MERKSVFISYAHKDGMEFTRRLAFALEMYMDVFWDRNLQAGKFPEQLKQQIEERGFFVFVMTPYSKNSKWCLRELRHAEKNQKLILLAHIYQVDDMSLYEHLTSEYTYGDFTEDFDAGFRRVTSLILGEPFSSWEHLSQQNDDMVLLTHLVDGQIPGLIAKSLAEWMLVDKIWPEYKAYFDGIELSFQAHPRTLSGIKRYCETLLEEFAQLRDGSKIFKAREMTQKIIPMTSSILQLSDNRHAECGKVAHETLLKLEQAIADHYASMREFDLYGNVQNNNAIKFDAAEKLRELLTIHARRSRYLY